MNSFERTDEFDFLVIGSGLAGLAFALKAARRGTVAVVVKTDAEDTNTWMAQGGIAAVTSEADSFSKHIDDTLTAGAGLCRREAVENFVSQGPDRIRDLVEWGVRFDGSASGDALYDLHREGGHNERRILHVHDHTGRVIHEQLHRRAREEPNIRFFENHFAVELIRKHGVDPWAAGPDRCMGALVLDKARGDVKALRAPWTVLATGGAGKVYLYTSNWAGATGDGIAMAYRAGARVANLEFMQFHPTCLYHPQSRNFLITEAIRGEGGELVNAQGEAFMKKHHTMGSLAPRDIVARSIDAEIKRTGAPCVYIDITHQSEDFLRAHFPSIFARCESLGINPARDPIPVVPAAHYLCGGVMTDVDGRTDLEGLFALGETACTGLHGANRLASNSLLECIASAHNASAAIERFGRPPAWTDLRRLDVPIPSRPGGHDDDELIVISHMWDEIRRLMWNYVGIVRTNRRLERAHHRLANILEEIDEYYSHYGWNTDIEELRNIALVADLTVKCARQRPESRGIHYNLDYPNTLPTARDSVV